MAKYTAFILALAIVLSLAACGGSDGTKEEESMKAESALTLSGHDIDEFTVLYTEEKYKESALLFAELLKAETGTELKVEALAAGSAEVRVVVGMPENAEDVAPCDFEFAEALTEGSTAHVIEQKEGVLFLAAADEWTAYDAVYDFVNNYVKEGDGVIRGISKTSSETAPVTRDETALRVMTLNTYASNGDYGKRYPYMEALLKRYRPDIAGLQEVNDRVYRGVVAKLPKEYATAGETIDGTNDKSYTPIIYRKDKFKPIEVGVRFLRKRYEGTNTKTICFAVFERLDGGGRFGVVNLHGAIILESYKLEATNKVEGAEWRTDNAKQMLELADELREKYGDLPLVFTGDFNCNKSSEAYKTIVGAGLSDAEFDADEVLITGIKTHHDVGVYPDEGKSIDHIFYNEGLRATEHVILTEEFCLRATDHCPVYADFKFKS